MRNAIKIIPLILIICSCVSATSITKEQGTGRTHIYKLPYDVVWNATIDIVEESTLQILSNDKEEGVIKCQQPISSLSYGEVVAVFVERMQSDSITKVEVVSRRVVATNILVKNIWEKEIITELDKRLKQD